MTVALFLAALSVLPQGKPFDQAQGKPEPFELAEGDRVLFIGGAFVERDLPHNHLEARLTALFHGRNVTFRNLGWSGDTVWGHARAGFGAPQDGFDHLVKHAADLKPTVVFLAYGMNESFEGERGLPDFVKQLEHLLDLLSRDRPRVVMLSPIRHEDLGRPLPDPAEHNKNLRLYIESMKKTAAGRGLRFVDLFELLGSGAPERPLTDNGIHLNDYGYRRAAAVIEEALGLPPRKWTIEIEAAQGTCRAEGVKVTELQATTTGVRFAATDERLPAAPRALSIRGLASGRYVLKAGDAVVISSSEEGLGRGVTLTKGPEFDQAEKLRKTIEAKNFQYFNRWRPQNETYIFGFRKKEQGHLAPEIPQFDPIVTEKEAEIARLRVPQPRVYVLEREK